MSSSDEGAGCAMICLWLFGSAMGLLLGGVKGCESGRDIERDKAKEANVGRWIVDEQTGDKQFVYGPAP